MQQEIGYTSSNIESCNVVMKITATNTISTPLLQIYQSVPPNGDDE